MAGEYSPLFGYEQDWQVDYWTEVLSNRGLLSFTADSRKGENNDYWVDNIILQLTLELEHSTYIAACNHKGELFLNGEEAFEDDNAMYLTWTNFFT